jgi:MFS family permease
MSGVFGICNNLGGTVNLVLIDRVGRRILFLSGLIILSICLAIFAACSAEYGQTGNSSWGKAGIGMVMVFIFFFGSTFAASPYAYAAEVLPTKIRANGMSMALFASNAVTVIFSQTAPIALSNITWKFNLVFIGCNLFFLPIVFFFFPETKGLTLEEVNRAFGDKVEMEMSDITDVEAEKQAVTFKHEE